MSSRIFSFLKVVTRNDVEANVDSPVATGVDKRKESTRVRRNDDAMKNNCWNQNQNKIQLITK